MVINLRKKKELNTKKVLLISIMLIALTALLTGVGTMAYFSASQTTGPHNFFTGSIDFSINGQDPWTGNFNATLNDIKPGMTGWGNVTVQNTGQNPADFWINIGNVSTSSFGTNSAKLSESNATDIDGVIRYGLYNYTVGSAFPSVYVNPGPGGAAPFYTISNGTHQLAGVTTGVKNYWIYMGTVQPGASNAVNVNESFTMDSGTTNWAQLTNMTFSVNFYAQQSQGSPQPAAPTNQLSGHTR